MCRREFPSELPRSRSREGYVHACSRCGCAGNGVGGEPVVRFGLEPADRGEVTMEVRVPALLDHGALELFALRVVVGARAGIRGWRISLGVGA